MDFKTYKNLLEQSSKIYNKIPVKEKTYMEVSGYPHYENVSSNILAFYFNPNEEHQLKKLPLNSLIKILKKHNISINLDENISNINVQREYITLKGNRIDLVIQNNDFLIGIENKLDACVYNDLNDYANTLDKLNENSIKILLSLHNIEKTVENTEFINITYQEYFNQLKEDLNKIQEKSNKWYIFLEEFIKNLENFEGEKEMEEEIINWLGENQKEIEELDKIRKIAYKSIEKKQEELKTLLEDRLKVNFIKISKDNYDLYCYIDSPCKYHVDAMLNANGWKIGLFTWSTINGNMIKQIIAKSNYNIIEDDTKHVWLFEFDYKTSVKEILNKVIEIYNYVENEYENSIS